MIREILEAEGIEVVVDAGDVRFAKRRNGFHLVPPDGAHPITGTPTDRGGPQANTDDLGLDKAGVQTDDRGYIVVDDELRTNVGHIWAMGNCNGRGAFTHTSYNDFEIVAGNIGVLDGVHRRVSDRVTSYALYIDPPLGRAGKTVAEVRRSGRKALVGKRPMTRVARCRKGETEGFMKVVSTPTLTRSSVRRSWGLVGSTDYGRCSLPAIVVRPPSGRPPSVQRAPGPDRSSRRGRPGRRPGRSRYPQAARDRGAPVRSCATFRDTRKPAARASR